MFCISLMELLQRLTGAGLIGKHRLRLTLRWRNEVSAADPRVLLSAGLKQERSLRRQLPYFQRFKKNNNTGYPA